MHRPPDLDNFLDIESSHPILPVATDQIDLLLLAPQGVLFDALKMVLFQSGIFNCIIHHNDPDCLDGAKPTGVRPLTLCVFIEIAKDLEKLRLCKSRLPGQTRIIAVCAESLEVAVLSRAIKEGAHSLISFASPLDELIFAIKRTARGEKVLSEGIERILMEDILDESTANQPLTRREQQVLEMVCSGQTMKEIAYSLKLSPHTIQFYHRSVMEKVGVNRTADLIVYAMRSGLYSG